MSELESKAPLAYWLCQAGGWSALSLLKIWVAVDWAHLSVAPAVTTIVLLDAAALTLSHLLRGFMRRRRWYLLSIGPLSVRITAAGVALAVPLGIATSLSVLSTLQLPESWLQGVPTRWNVDLLPALTLMVNVFNWALIIGVWLIMYFSVVRIREHRGAALRQSELARALQQAELRLLKSHLNPHFLFNALNTIRYLVTEDPHKAQGALTRLANTLRNNLKANLQEVVTLAHELDTVTDYLELEKLRFEERLTVRFEVTPDASKALIPVLFLQTLIENSMKHGIAHLPAGGEIVLIARVEDGILHVDIQNPCPQEIPLSSGEGTGLRNSEERLRLLFDTRASLQLDRSTPGLAVARLRVPQTS